MLPSLIAINLQNKKKVQVGNDQEMTQSERNSHSTNLGSDVRLYDGPDLKLFILGGWSRSFFSVAWPTGVQLVSFAPELVSYSAPRGLHRRAAY